jgi:hypothetical protein
MEARQGFRGGGVTPLDADRYLESNVEAHQRKWTIAPSWPAAAPYDEAMWASLHGSDPIAEASAWLDRATADRTIPDTVCVIGAGLGYVVDAVVERSKSRVLVLETEPALLPWFLARRDWRPFIESGRLAVLAGPGFEGSQIAWRLFGDGEASPLVLAHPLLGKSRPDVTRLAAQVIGRARQGARGNEEARRKFAAPYLVNTLLNAPRIARAASVDVLEHRYRGMPIVVAAAGPSLNRNIEDLRPYRDRVVLLSVDTALKPLLAADLAPDFVVALDPSDANARHLTGVTVPDSTSLVAEPSIAASSFTAFGDRVFIFRVAEHAPWPWLRKMGIDCGMLRAWGSVVTSTFDLALRMGGDPVVFIGTDLAYTNGQPYARGTTYEEDWKLTAGDRPVQWVWEQVVAHRGVPADGIGGNKVVSAKGLLVFRDWLVEDSKRPGRPRLINATGAGILFGGMFEQLSLPETLAGISARWPPGSGATPHVARPAPADSTSPVDVHLLDALLHQPAPPAARASEHVQPYLVKPRKQRIAATRSLRAQRETDHDRWGEPANLDPRWDYGPARASRFVPKGSRVLDLGAGLEALGRYLPDGCTYTPSDIVSRSDRTIAADLNRGELPAGEFDVVAIIATLEFVHDVDGLLAAIRRRAALAVLTYCARTSDDLNQRLEKGFVNDLTRDELVLLCQKKGWQVVAAERLVAGPGFDQWLFALRRSE